MEIGFRVSAYCASLLILTEKFTTASTESLQQHTESNHTLVKRIFQKAFPHDYDGNEPPQNGEIFIAIAVLSIPSVHFSRMEIEVELFFVALWRDERLTFDDTENEFWKNHDFISAPETARQRVWEPWIAFANCKKCKNGFATGERTRLLHFRTGPKSFVIVFRDTKLFGCNYDLSFYPFDSHTCSINIELYELTPTNGSVQITDGYSFIFQHKMDKTSNPIMPSEFYLDDLFVKQRCHSSMLGLVRPDVLCLEYGFSFHRISYSYLMLIYTPSFIIVLISWISFWLDPDNSPPRVTLGLTSMLTLTTQFSNAQSNLPPVAYTKALDIWMIMCVIMVFGSLLEFTLAHSFSKTSQKNVEPIAKPRHTKISAPVFTVKIIKIPVEPPKTQKVNRFDAVSKVLFPVVFLVFNVIYWPYFARTG